MEGGSCNALSLEHKLRDGDDHQYGGVLDVDDQFVSDGRECISDSLRQDNTHHRLCIGHAQRAGGFRLSGVNRLNAGADDFGHIGACVDADNEDGSAHTVPVDDIQERIVDEDSLYHHWSAAEHQDVDVGDHIKDFFEKARRRTGRDVQPDGPEAADQKTKHQPEGRTDKRHN